MLITYLPEGHTIFLTEEQKRIVLSLIDYFAEEYNEQKSSIDELLQKAINKQLKDWENLYLNPNRQARRNKW